MSRYTCKARHDKMVSLVEQMLVLYKGLAYPTGMISARTPSEKDRLMREVEPSADKGIDGLVALRELYELSEEEIKIVEG